MAKRTPQKTAAARYEHAVDMARIFAREANENAADPKKSCVAEFYQGRASAFEVMLHVLTDWAEELEH